MIKHTNITIVLLVILLCAFTNNAPKPALSSIKLLNTSNEAVYLTNITKNKATAFIFLSPECPLCQSYTLTINKLHQKYNVKGVELIGIIPTTDFSLPDILTYQKTYNLSITLLRDEHNNLVKYFGASITPEVFLVNSKLEVIYSGRIDNWAYELGKKRKVITEHNLIDAIDLTLANKPVTTKKTEAVGCFID
jgi:thiol-disulfide isomerase/thioredoxin